MKNLRLELGTQAAAKLALSRWYYRDTLPVGKRFVLAAFEDGAFIGCLIFGYSASSALGKRWGWSCRECVELLRVALGPHATPTTRIIAIGLKLLKRHNPGLRAVVTFCDPAAGHSGTIYRAGGWLYQGKTGADKGYVHKVTRVYYHSRNVRRCGYYVLANGVHQPCPRPDECEAIPLTPKLRYAIGLDAAATAVLQSTCVESNDGVVPPSPGGEGGSSPTSTLHSPSALSDR